MLNRKDHNRMNKLNEKLRNTGVKIRQRRLTRRNVAHNTLVMMNPFAILYDKSYTVETISVHPDLDSVEQKLHLLGLVS